MAITVAFWVSAVFGNVFLCQPTQKIWLLYGPGYCGDSTTFHTALASIDLIISIIIIGLPMPILWNLQLATAKKVYLTFIFGLGFMCVLHPYSADLHVLLMHSNHWAF